MKKESKEKLIVIFTILLFFALLYFFIKMFEKIENKKIDIIEVSTKDFHQVLINENPINIDKIIDENRNINIREEMSFEELDLEYTTQYINNEDLPSGTIHVSQLGINGVQDVITIKRYDGEELISEQIVANNINKASINKIVEIGTGSR